MLNIFIFYFWIILIYFVWPDHKPWQQVCTFKMAKQSPTDGWVPIPTNITQKLWGRKPCRAICVSPGCNWAPTQCAWSARGEAQNPWGKVKPANFCAFVGLVPSATPGARSNVRYSLEIISFLSVELEKLEHKMPACDNSYVFSALELRLKRMDIP